MDEAPGTPPAVRLAREGGFGSTFVETNGVQLHVVRHGRGTPLVLLHGWPEFWFSWRKVMALLAHEFVLVAPDLREFGTSDKAEAGPSRTAGPEVHAADLLRVLDALGLRRVGVVSHDVGAYVAQVFARQHPERVSGLFFFNCPILGLAHGGPRPGTWARSDINRSTSSPRRRSWSAAHAPPLGSIWAISSRIGPMTRTRSMRSWSRGSTTFWSRGDCRPGSTGISRSSSRAGRSWRAGPPRCRRSACRHACSGAETIRS
jgi:pimeloyl-ACP methyl ester carboxylesterase